MVSRVLPAPPERMAAIDRLAELPSMFRGGDLTVRYGWDSTTASIYLRRWKARGFIAAMGGHSDVYANLVVEKTPDWGRGVMMAMPDALLFRVEPLRVAGWTTQIQRRPSLAVPPRAPRYAIAPYDVSLRNARWFRLMAQGAAVDRIHGIRTLRPAWALADMLSPGGWDTCPLDPDDIDCDAMETRDVEDLRAACAAIGVDAAVIEALDLDELRPDPPAPAPRRPVGSGRF